MSMEEHQIKLELEKAKAEANRAEDGGIAIQTSSKTLPRYQTPEKSVRTPSRTTEVEKPHPTKPGMSNMGNQLNDVGNSETFYAPPGRFVTSKLEKEPRTAEQGNDPKTRDAVTDAKTKDTACDPIVIDQTTESAEKRRQEQEIRVKSRNSSSHARRISNISASRSRQKSFESNLQVKNDFQVVPLNHEHRLDKAVEE